MNQHRQSCSVCAYEPGQRDFRQCHNKHTLLILSGDASPEHVQKVLSPLWVKSCVSAGLPAPTLDIGLTVQDGSYADDYVCKWGLESEMTKGHSKVAKVGGFTQIGRAHV